MATMTCSMPRLAPLVCLVLISACGAGGSDFVLSLVDEARREPERFSHNLGDQLIDQPLFVAVDAMNWHGGVPLLNERVRLAAVARLGRAKAHEITPDVVSELMRMAEAGEAELFHELAASPVSRSTLFSSIHNGDGEFAANIAVAFLKTAKGFDDRTESVEHELARSVLWDIYQQERVTIDSDSYSRVSCIFSEVSYLYCAELKAALAAAFEGTQPLFKDDLNNYAGSSCPSALEDMFRWSQHSDRRLADRASKELLERTAYFSKKIPSNQTGLARAFLLTVAKGSDESVRDTAAFGLANYVSGASEQEIDEMLTLIDSDEDDGLLAALTEVSAIARVEFASRLNSADRPERLVNALVDNTKSSRWSLATLRSWAAGWTARANQQEHHYSHYFAVQALEEFFGQTFFPRQGEGQERIQFMCGTHITHMQQMMEDDLYALGLPPPILSNTRDDDTDEPDADAAAEEAQQLAESVSRLQAARAAFIAYADAELAR